MGVEEPIDFDRVISDQSYRRDVIDYLNRRDSNGSSGMEMYPRDSGATTFRSFEGNSSLAQNDL